MRALRTPFFVLGLFLLGCSSPEPDEAELEQALQEEMSVLTAHLAERAISDDGSVEGIRVRLAFDGAVDLDLYVTDPQMETVYFANHESKSGGAITDDQRCGGEGIRVEEVFFAVPTKGRYRVGVDYPEHCAGLESPAAHSVHVSFGGQDLAFEGAVDLQKFDVIVLEFDFDGATIKEPEK